MWTLATVAELVDAPPKWVLNTLAAVDPAARYSDALARQLIVTRLLQTACHLPLLYAYALAARVLHGWHGEPAPVTVPLHDDAAVTVDVYRLIASLQIRRAAAAASGANRVRSRPRGRPRTRARDAVAAAQDWGLDLSLIRDNLRRTPAERLQQLDAMHAFASRARRISPPAARSTTDDV